MKLRRILFHPRTVQSETGGALADGPFRVKLATVGFKLIYSEGECKLTLPVEYGLDGSCNIGTVFIRHWNGSSEIFGKDQIFTIEKNIFAALDHMHIRYTNIR
jgi:hypothetical protein